ncbi:MAG: VCBS repeat-containing protein, partial [Planctomycetes bacterium]|nr:VCBS repeat-containing protein [Planctomycetota bacterium]
DGVLDLFVANYVNWSPENDIYTTLDGQRKSYSTPAVYEGQSCRLYRGLGDGTFEDVTEAAGVYNPQGKSMAVAFEDIDDDGFVDIFVTNDTQPNFLYLNLGNGTFEDAALAAGVGFDENGRARAGMGVDVADLANTGKVSIAIGNFSREPISLYELQDEGPLFLDVAGSWGVSRHSLMTLTFPLVFADFDADGYKDMLVGNGHL